MTPAQRPAPAIRLAGEADLDDLVDLWERSARTSHRFMADSDFADARPYLRDALMPSMDLWVAEDSAAHPLGLVGVRETHIELLYVEPDVHGSGVGTALLRHVAPTSVEVYAGNTHGLGFYRSHGFRVLRTHTTDAFGRPFPVVHLIREPATR